MSIKPEQLAMLIKMTDPKKLASLKEKGLPTVELSAIKEQAQKKLSAKIADITSSISSTVGAMMETVDKMIEEKAAEIEKLGKAAIKTANALPSSLPGVGGQASNLINMEIAKLKQAKEHGLETGNFVPLLALLNPTMNLKSLMKDTVVLPKPEVPPIPGFENIV